MDNLNEIMAKDVFSSTPDTSLAEIDRLMVEHDCGEIPLVENSKVVTYSGKYTGEGASFYVLLPTEYKGPILVNILLLIK